MRTARTITLGAAAALILSACGDASELAPDSDPDPAPQENADDEAAAEDEVADEPDDEPDPDDELADVDEDDAHDMWQFIEEFDDPFVHEDGGVRLSITGLAISDVTSDDAPDEVVEFLDEGTQTVLVLEITASNDSGAEIDFFPAQGEIQIGREQVEPDLWFTESFAGMDWRDGVDDTGQVFYELEQSYDDAVDEGLLTYIASDPLDAEEFTAVAEGFEIEVSW